MNSSCSQGSPKLLILWDVALGIKSSVLYVAGTHSTTSKGAFILFSERKWNNEACVHTKVMELADALYKKTRGIYCDGTCIHLVKVLN